MQTARFRWQPGARRMGSDTVLEGGRGWTVWSRCNASGESGAVCVSEQVWEVVGASCTGTALAPIEVKGKGRLARWRVEGIGP